MHQLNRIAAYALGTALFAYAPVALGQDCSAAGAQGLTIGTVTACLLYTSDAADE